MSLFSCGPRGARVRKFLIAGFALMALAVAVPVQAQLWEKLTNPQIPVNLTHPPRLGLNIKRIVFAPVWGRCSEEITGQLASTLMANGVEVVDQNAFNVMLVQRHLRLAPQLNEQSAMAMGRAVGPGALVFVRVTSCDVDRHRTFTERREEVRDDRRDDNNYQNNDRGYQNNDRNSQNSQNSQNNKDNKSQPQRPAEKRYRTVRMNRAITEFHLRGAIQTVDLATGRIFSAAPIMQDGMLENRMEDRMPDFPPDGAVREPALNRAAYEASTMYVPWTETRPLYFYDDKECNMKAAYSLLKAGDLQGTLRLSLEIVDNCKNWPKVKDNHIAHAYYNAGISYMIVNQYDRALEFLRESARMKPSDIVSQTINETNRAMQAEVEMRQVAQQTDMFEQSQSQAVEPVPPPAPAQAAPAAPAAGNAQGTVAERLKQLDTLYKQGLINQKEYEAKRQLILSTL